MSTSPARRRRLAIARTFRQATCAECGADLSRVDFPAIHLERCERAAFALASAGVPEPERPPLLRRVLSRLIPTRGADE